VASIHHRWGSLPCLSDINISKDIGNFTGGPRRFRFICQSLFTKTNFLFLFTATEKLSAHNHIPGSIFLNKTNNILIKRIQRPVKGRCAYQHNSSRQIGLPWNETAQEGSPEIDRSLQRFHLPQSQPSKRWDEQENKKKTSRAGRPRG